MFSGQVCSIFCIHCKSTYVFPNDFFLQLLDVPFYRRADICALLFLLLFSYLYYTILCAFCPDLGNDGGHLFLFLLRKFPALYSSYAVYVPLEIASVEQFGKDKLFKGRNGAGIKSESFVKRLD